MSDYLESIEPRLRAIEAQLAHDSSSAHSMEQGQHNTAEQIKKMLAEIESLRKRVEAAESKKSLSWSDVNAALLKMLPALAEPIAARIDRLEDKLGIDIETKNSRLELDIAKSLNAAQAAKRSARAYLQTLAVAIAKE